MVALMLIILMDLIVMAMVMYFGTRPDDHAPTLQSRSVVAMQALARERKQQLEAQVTKASAGGESQDSGASAEDAEATKAAAAARREAALARKAAKQKAGNSDG